MTAIISAAAAASPATLRGETARQVSGTAPFPGFPVSSWNGTSGHYIRDALGDPDMCEYFVPVKWMQTVPASQALKEPGLAGYRLTVCRPHGEIWSHTVA